MPGAVCVSFFTSFSGQCNSRKLVSTVLTYLLKAKFHFSTHLLISLSLTGEAGSEVGEVGEGLAVLAVVSRCLKYWLQKWTFLMSAPISICSSGSLLSINLLTFSRHLQHVQIIIYNICSFIPIGNCECFSLWHFIWRLWLMIDDSRFFIKSPWHTMSDDYTWYFHRIPTYP